MRIVQIERIIISESERETLTAFERMLDGLERGSNNSSTLEIVGDLQSRLTDLWEAIHDID